MARMHGKDVRAYLGVRDVSGDVMTITPEASGETHDVTVLDNANYKSFDPGLAVWAAQFEALYQPQTGGIGQQLEAVGSSFVLSIYDGDADAVGETGFLGNEGVLTQRGQPVTVVDLIKLSMSLQGSGRPGLNAKLLHVLGAETGSGNGTAFNGGVQGAAVTITSSSVANPTVITTAAAHGLATGDSVVIAGHSGSTPSINAEYAVTVVTSTTFTIAVNVTVGGTGGTMTKTNSNNGGIANLHVTAATGSGVVKVQHSVDNLTWADLITFTAAAAATAESKSVTGVVNRYLRDNHAPGTSITYVMGFARH